MKTSYLVDTDWVVHHLNGVEEVGVKLREFQPEGLGVSVISLAELYEGVYYSRDRERSRHQLKDFLSSVTILGINEDICEIFGHQRGYLRRQGLMIGDFDLMVAATCLHYGLKLLTNNRQHFQRIEGFHLHWVSRNNAHHI